MEGPGLYAHGVSPSKAKESTGPGSLDDPHKEVPWCISVRRTGSASVRSAWSGRGGQANMYGNQRASGPTLEKHGSATGTSLEKSKSLPKSEVWLLDLQLKSWTASRLEAPNSFERATAPTKGRARHTERCVSVGLGEQAGKAQRTGRHFALASVGWSPVAGRM